MKLLSILIAAVFAIVTFSAVAADAPMGAEALNHNATAEAKPAKKAHNRHHHHYKTHGHKKADYPAK
jgi:ABC-type nickel/cobalt efflux system permease component RcnA